MRLKYLLKTTRQLGLTQVALFALYKLGLKSGYYKRVPTPDSQFPNSNSQHLFIFPSREELLFILGDEGKNILLTEADYIVDGRFHIFGSELTDIKLDLGLPLAHWTAYETRKAPIPDSRFSTPALNLPPSTFDLKLIWEPARFGWAFTLGRAYLASGDEKYPAAFWRYFEIFDKANPPSLGPNRMNGQEVAVRLMAFVWAGQIFADSAESTRARKARLAQSIAEHASRIPPTLLYARSQNNNHLLSEAVGLYTAALALPAHPQAEKWRKLGIKWMNWGFENQIDENGEYIQHSVTYHRLVLQLALWVNVLNTKDTKKHKGKRKEKEKKLCDPLCPSCLKKIALATHWLADLTDPISGNAPNLGANDGAYLFPLTNAAFRDFRPVVNAASRVFLNEKPFPADEMSLWFESLNVQTFKRFNLPTFKPSNVTWASLRVVSGNLRLAHADQLHFDLWWRGENITLDPGSYLYNGEKPWDNPLVTAEFHNTVTVNGLDQMTRTGKFMYLDWSRGRVVERSDGRIVAEHDGYRKLGVTHRRLVSFEKNIWRVEDNLQTFKRSTCKLCTYRLHWLLPDWEYELENREESVEIRLKSPQGVIKITQYATRNTQPLATDFSIVKAGNPLYGNTSPNPARGWYSPTYGVKIPALSLALEVTAKSEVQFTTEFLFSDP